MADHTAIEDELRAEFRTLTVSPDDALADAMSARAMRRRRRTVVPASTTVAVAAMIAAAVFVTVPHGNPPARSTPSPTPVADLSTAVPTPSGSVVIHLQCTASDGRVTRPVITTTPGAGASAGRGNWARIYLPQPDGSICHIVP